MCLHAGVLTPLQPLLPLLAGRPADLAAVLSAAATVASSARVACLHLSAAASPEGAPAAVAGLLRAATAGARLDARQGAFVAAAAATLDAAAAPTGAAAAGALAIAAAALEAADGPSTRLAHHHSYVQAATLDARAVCAADAAAAAAAPAVSARHAAAAAAAAAIAADAWHALLPSDAASLSIAARWCAARARSPRPPRARLATARPPLQPRRARRLRCAVN